jgi:hypothetical protein
MTWMPRVGYRDSRICSPAAVVVWLPYSSNLCDETRDSRFHHLIEPLPGPHAIDFVHRILRKGRDVKILARASRGFG